MSDWIKHDGEKRPVDPNTLVRVKLRDLREESDTAMFFDWGHINDTSDITEYQVIKEAPTAETTGGAFNRQEGGVDYVDKTTNALYPEELMPSELDPNGLPNHSPGAKLDAGKVRPELIIRGFSRALLAVADVGTYGANKYSDDGWQHVPDGIKRYTDAMYRHLLREHIGELCDKDTGMQHAAHAAWNALARLELMLRSAERAREDDDGAGRDVKQQQ